MAPHRTGRGRTSVVRAALLRSLAVVARLALRPVVDALGEVARLARLLLLDALGEVALGSLRLCALALGEVAHVLFVRQIPALPLKTSLDVSLRPPPQRARRRTVPLPSLRMDGAPADLTHPVAALLSER